MEMVMNAKKLVLYAITALSPVDLSVWKLLIFLCVHTLKTVNIQNQIPWLGKLDTNGKPQLAVDCCT
jgi:hypothetical protein